MKLKLKTNDIPVLTIIRREQYNLYLQTCAWKTHDVKQRQY